MAGDMNLWSLGIEVDASSGTASIKSFTRATEESTTATGKQEKAVSSLNSTLKLLASTYAAAQATRHLGEVTTLAARYETLGVVMEQVGRTAGYSATEMRVYQAALQKTGISAIEARNNLAKMIQSNLDLTQSTKLARIAQDAAVIGNLNSSEAFASLIHGIQNGNTLILRNIGILVDFDAAHRKFAQSLGKEQHELTELEKAQARANAVVASGTAIAGAYEASMETAGKQINSAKRYLEDMQVAVGGAFLPQYTAAVFAYADALKWLGENAALVSGALAGLASAATLLAAGIGASKLLTFLGAMGPTGWAAVAALTAVGLAIGAYVSKQAEASRQSDESYRGAIKYKDALNEMTVAALEAEVAERKLAVARAANVTAAAPSATRSWLETLTGRPTSKVDAFGNPIVTRAQREAEAALQAEQARLATELSLAETALARARGLAETAGERQRAAERAAYEERKREWTETRAERARQAQEEAQWEAEEWERAQRRTARARQAAAGAARAVLESARAQRGATSVAQGAFDARIIERYTDRGVQWDPATGRVEAPIKRIWNSEAERQVILRAERLEREARERRQAAALVAAQNENLAREQLQQAFLTRMADSMSSFFERILSDGTTNWRSLWESFRSLGVSAIGGVLGTNLLRALKDKVSDLLSFESADGKFSLGGKLAMPLGIAGMLGAGYWAGRSGGPAGGVIGGGIGGASIASAIAGLNPAVGALVGGVAGLIGAFTSMSGKAREEAARLAEAARLFVEQMRALRRSWEQSFEDFASVNESPLDRELRGIRRQADDLAFDSWQRFNTRWQDASPSARARYGAPPRVEGIDGVQAWLAWFEQKMLPELQAMGAGPDNVWMQTYNELKRLSQAYAEQTEAAREAEAAVRAQARAQAALSLEQFRTSLQLSPLSTLNPIQQRTAALANYNAILAKAQGGDLGAVDALPEAARAFLEASKAIYGSTSRYVDDYNRVWGETGALLENLKTVEETIAEYTGEMMHNTAQLVTTQQATLSVLQEGFQQTVETLAEVVGELTGLKGEMAALREAGVLSA